MSLNNYCLVKFISDNSISMIPRTWWVGNMEINEKGKIYWPATGQYSKIKNQIPPEKDWQQFEGILKMSATIKSHEEGLKLERQFEAMESGTEEEEFATTRNLEKTHILNVSLDQLFFEPMKETLSANKTAHESSSVVESASSSPLINNFQQDDKNKEYETIVDASEIYTVPQFQKDFKQHEERMEALMNKMFMENQKKLQLFIKEEFLAYEKAFTRKISVCKCRGENAEPKPNSADDELEKEMRSRFSLPLNTTEELLKWNTAIKDDAYHKFMKNYIGMFIGMDGQNRKAEDAAFECFSRLLSLDLMAVMSWSGVSRTTGVEKFKFNSMDNTIDFITSVVQRASNTSWVMSNTKKAFADIVLKNAIKKKRTTKVPSIVNDDDASSKSPMGTTECEPA